MEIRHLWIMLTVAGCHGAEPVNAVLSDAVLSMAPRERPAGVCQNLSAGAVPPYVIDICRPDPVSDAEREFVLQSLPHTGEITSLPVAHRKKLAALEVVLRAHERLNVYKVKVINVPQATAVLHGRSILLFTAPALALLNSQELQAIAAHEIGHEYFWEEYVRGRESDDFRKLQELELLCDAVAVRTLQQIGVSTSVLATALEKLLRYNTSRFGIPLNASHYPDLSARVALVKSYASR